MTDDHRPLYRNRDQREGMTKREEAAIELAAALVIAGHATRTPSHARALAAHAVDLADHVWDALDNVPHEAHDDGWTRP